MPKEKHVRLSAAVPGDTPADKVRTAREIGLTGTDIWFDPDSPTFEPESIRSLFHDNGVALSQVSCYVNLEQAPGASRDLQMERLRKVIAFAGAAGARCVVSGCGHMHPDKAEEVFAAHPDNWTDAAMDRLAASCAEAATWAHEAGTIFTAESWVLLTLNSPRKLRELVQRVDHPGFGILFDPVNLMNLDVYFDTGRMIQEAFDQVGDRIVAVHAKDTLLIESSFTYHMSEAPPGKGTLDYETLLRCMDGLNDQDTPLHIEHLRSLDAVVEARDAIRGVADRLGIAMA